MGHNVLFSVVRGVIQTLVHCHALTPTDTRRSILLKWMMSKRFQNALCASHFIFVGLRMQKILHFF